MRWSPTPLAGLYLLEPLVFRDERGQFLETWSERRYAAAGVTKPFVQDNAAVSSRGVLRGLHYQSPHPQGKLVSVLEGEVYDVVVDLRAGSATFGDWYGYTLSSQNGHQLYIPEGFAHGYLTLSERAVFAYKCTDYYEPACESTLLWNDATLAIDWPIAEPILSPKDRAGRPFAEVQAVASVGR